MHEVVSEQVHLQFRRFSHANYRSAIAPPTSITTPWGVLWPQTGSALSNPRSWSLDPGLVSQEDFILICMESDCFRNQHEDGIIILKLNVFKLHCSGSSKSPETFFIFRNRMRRITWVQRCYTTLAGPLQSGCRKRVNYLWRLKLVSVGLLVHAYDKTAHGLLWHSFDRVFRLKCTSHFSKKKLTNSYQQKLLLPLFANLPSSPEYCNCDKLFGECIIFYYEKYQFVGC